MQDEPIKISSQAWTGLTDAPEVQGASKPKPKPSRIKSLFVSAAAALISGTQVVSAITEHVVHRRANFISHVSTVRQAEHPTLFSVTACSAFVLMLASSALTIFILIDWWSVKVRKRTSPIDWAGDA